MNFEEQLSEKVGQINQALLDALPKGDVKPSRLHEAIRIVLKREARDCVRFC